MTDKDVCAIYGRVYNRKRIFNWKVLLIVILITIVLHILSQVFDKAAAALGSLIYDNVSTEVAIFVFLLSVVVSVSVFYKRHRYSDDFVKIEDDSLVFRKSADKIETTAFPLEEVEKFDVRNFLLFKVYYFKLRENIFIIRQSIIVSMDDVDYRNRDNLVRKMEETSATVSSGNPIYPIFGILYAMSVIFTTLAPAVAVYLVAEVKRSLVGFQERSDNTSTRGLLRREIANTRANLPVKLNRSTIFQDIELVGNTVVLSYVFDVPDRNLVDFRRNFESSGWRSIIKSNCSDPNVMKIYGSGEFSQRFQYFSSSGNLVGDFVFTASLCAGN